MGLAQRPSEFGAQDPLTTSERGVGQTSPAPGFQLGLQASPACREGWQQAICSGLGWGGEAGSAKWPFCWDPA